MSSDPNKGPTGLNANSSSTGVTGLTGVTGPTGATGSTGAQPPAGDVPPPPSPPTLLSVSVNPTSIAGGTTLRGKVTLTGAAPSGGAVVTLSDNSAAATTPPNVTVAAGETSASFNITTLPVTESTSVTVTASFGGASREATLTVQTPSRDPRFFALTVAQSALIGLITLTFVVVLAIRAWYVKDLGNVEEARGLITFVITVGTIAIAIMLAISAMFTREFEPRVAVGKEILAILIGVLGTIVGFYYGAAVKEGVVGNNPPAQTSPAPVTNTLPQITSGPPPTFSTKLSGGTPPYSYSIRFTPNTIPAIENQESANGEINHQFNVPIPPAGTEVVFVIEGTDKNKVAFEINKDGKQKILVR